MQSSASWFVTLLASQAHRALANPIIAADVSRDIRGCGSISSLALLLMTLKLIRTGSVIALNDQGN
jgi:hypothetical protein